MSWLRIALIVAPLLCSGTAEAKQEGCRAEIQQTSDSRMQGYEPFAASDTQVRMVVTIANKGDQPCSARLTATSDGSGDRRLTSGGNSLSYALISDRGDRLPNEEGAGAVGVPVLIPSDSRETVELIVLIPKGQVVPSGPYRDMVRFQLVGGDGSLADRGKQHLLNVHVAARAQVNVAGTAGSFASGVRSAVLDLGQLTDGVSRRAFLQIRANEPVRVRLTSTNGGKLRGINAPDQVISYRLSVDNEDVRLSSPYILQRSPPATIEGRAYEMIATVPVVGSVFAGEYRDLITIDIDG